MHSHDKDLLDRCAVLESQGSMLGESEISMEEESHETLLEESNISWGELKNFSYEESELPDISLDNLSTGLPDESNEILSDNAVGELYSEIIPLSAICEGSDKTALSVPLNEDGTAPISAVTNIETLAVQVHAGVEENKRDMLTGSENMLSNRIESSGESSHCVSSGSNPFSIASGDPKAPLAGYSRADVKPKRGRGRPRKIKDDKKGTSSKRPTKTAALPRQGLSKVAKRREISRPSRMPFDTTTRPCLVSLGYPVEHPKFDAQQACDGHLKNKRHKCESIKYDAGEGCHVELIVCAQKPSDLCPPEGLTLTTVSPPEAPNLTTGSPPEAPNLTTGSPPAASSSSIGSSPATPSSTTGKPPHSASMQHLLQLLGLPEAQGLNLRAVVGVEPLLGMRNMLQCLGTAVDKKLSPTPSTISSPSSGFSSPGSGFSSPGSGFSSPGSGFSSPGSDFSSPGSGSFNPWHTTLHRNSTAPHLVSKPLVHNFNISNCLSLPQMGELGSGMPSFHKIPLSESNVLHSRSNGPYPGSNVVYPGSNVSHPRSNASHTASNVPHPRSNIPHPRSNVPYPGTNIPYPGSNIPYPGLNIPYPGSNIPYAGSNVPYSGLNVPYPVVNVPYPVVNVPYPVVNVPYPVVNVPHAGSNAPYPSSNVPYPGSNAPYTGSTPPSSARKRWPGLVDSRGRSNASFPAPRSNASFPAPVLSSDGGSLVRVPD